MVEGMELDLTLVRHAEAAWQKGDVESDPPLTERGVAQAKVLAQRAARWKKPTHLFVSPALRARQTAEPLCAAVGVDAVVAPWLQEFALRNDARTAEDADAEAWGSFRSRATGGLGAALAAIGVVPRTAPGGTWDLAGADARIVLVGHGLAHAVLLEYLLGVEGVPWAGYRLQFGHAAFAGVRAFALPQGAVFGLVRYNESQHLPRELRTL